MSFVISPIEASIIAEYEAMKHAIFKTYCGHCDAGWIWVDETHAMRCACLGGPRG